MQIVLDKLNHLEAEYGRQYPQFASWLIEGLETEKQQIIGNYVQGRMCKHNLPYGLEYLNKVAQAEEDAEQYYSSTFKQ